jgi:hypothetical protein
METTLKITAYIWMAFCAVSHIRIDAKKKGEDLSFKSQGIWYIIQIILYWITTAIFII